MALLVIFEDEHLLLVNKPAGWNTHAPSPFAGEGIYDWLKHREPRWAKLAIIHRLDKETSGVMVFGKTPLANKALTEQFASREVLKKYLLLTDRPVPRDEFTALSAIKRAGDKYISGPLAPAAGAERGVGSAEFGGERAETKFRVLSRDAGRTLLEAEPLTGRTHQIRVHAAANGCPVLGDVLYGGTKADRVYLHAASLAFRHPATGENVCFEAAPEGGERWEARDKARRPVFGSPLSPLTSDLSLRPSYLRLRSSLIDPVQTNAFRLVHGASEGWPGFYVDRLGDFLLAESEQPLSQPQRELLDQLAATQRARGIYHKLLNRNVRRTAASDASPQLVAGEAAPSRFVIMENGVRFEVSFEEGYSVGLFLDQRDNRRRLLVNHIAAGFPVWSEGAPELLNVFSYTCGFSVTAAKGGARTTSLDLSRKYLDWGKTNFSLNQIDPARHDFIYGDAFDWMRRLGKKGRLYDVIVLDPPTFSQSKESGIWQAGKDYGKLVETALPLLKSGGVLFASTNATRLAPEEFLETIKAAISRKQRKIVQQHYAPQPPDFPISREEPAYLKTVWLRCQ